MRIRQILIYRALLPALLLVGSAVAVASSDTELEEAVRRELRLNPLIAMERVDVRVADGIVTLVGDQPVLVGLDRAARVAEGVPGVRQVVNSLELSQRREVDGARLEYNIRYVLLTDPATEHGRIAVEAGDFGDVTLRGTVANGAQRRLAALVAMNVAGVQSIDNRIEVESGVSRPDSEIVADVRRGLRWDVNVNSATIVVSAEDGVVTLSGAVQSVAEQRRAKNLSWVAGVRQVDATSLLVTPHMTATKQPPEPPSEQFDAAIADAARRAIKAHPRLPHAQIDVTVKQGIVTLQGFVASLQAKKIAHSIPLDLLGVRDVRDGVRVGGLIAKSYDDAEIRQRVERALALNSLTAGNPIAAPVRKGAVQLTGEVDRQYLRSVAEKLAEAVPGVRAVKNELTIASDGTRVVPIEPIANR
jgi:osmotically-inducible protein OsmY